MAEDFIRYDILTQDAMRGVIRTVLKDAAARGLPGEHHFFITFDTRQPGVKLSPRIRAQYPEQMTIVLQHQFWDLAITDDGFEVGLSFGGVREKLVVPFAAVTSFADPAVKFAMQFTDLSAEAEGAENGAGADKPAAAPLAKLEAAAEAKSDADAKPAAGAPKSDDGGDKPSDKVVRIDRFRKK